MSKVSFEDIGAVVATFMAKSGVEGGQVVKVTGSGTVGPCAAGEAFCGVAMEPRKGAAAVQVKGFVMASASEELDLGWAELVADGKGGVKKAAGTGGVKVLVVSADEKSAVICL